MESSSRRRTRPLSQVEIEEKILEDIDRLEEETEAFERLGIEAAEAEVAFKVGQAGAYLRASGSIKEREAHATFLTEELALAYKIAEARAKYGKELLSTIRAELDGHRSLNANVRPQVNG